MNRTLLSQLQELEERASLNPELFTIQELCDKRAELIEKIRVSR